MSLPPGFLDELRSRTSLADVAGKKVIWDTRKSNQAKGDLWAPCPFHQEKTASFHVDDRKGFYYCFGCHAKGDAISFVKDTENVGFMEAVEILAQEAGMQMPARDPRAQEKADRRTQLSDVMEMAVQHFRLQLRTGAGAAARDYLLGKRGLSEETLARFEIGFAPDGWQGLWDHLKGKGVDDDLIFAAGLAKMSSKSGNAYDVFRNRIMFPIRDPRGRAIAFGGRAMDPNDNAKYLNSPETELFDKSRTLYHHGPAREAAGKGAPLIVAEGYMDVIALAVAGFGASVAPLGTAVTEHQLAHLWRITDEPIIALDGDTAGLRAAYRVIDIALPLLAAGKSLRFALMPDGMDPDDLLHAKGPQGVRDILDAAQPMVSLLWRRETEGKILDSPERKAALDKTLRDALRLIRDDGVRRHYGDAIKEMRWELFRNNRPARRGNTWKPGPSAPLPSTKSSPLVAAGETAALDLRVRVILATALTTPQIIPEFDAQLENLPTEGLLDQLRHLVLSTTSHDATTLRDRAVAEIGAEAVDAVLAHPHVALNPCIRTPGDIEMARMTLAEEFAKLQTMQGRAAEIAEAEEELSGVADEAVTWRLSQAAEAHNRALTGSQEDKTEYDTGPNGARVNRSERDAFASMLEKITYAKPGRRSDR